MYITQKEFESYPHPIPILSSWIQAVLTTFIESLPPRLASLDRRYSAALESEQMMARYGVPKSTCDQLRQVHHQHHHLHLLLSLIVLIVDRFITQNARRLVQ